MSDTAVASFPLPIRRPSRRRRLDLLALLLLVILFAWLNWIQHRELREAMAEADRSDPHWRLADLEAHRVVLADEENGALQVQKAVKALPPNWPWWDSAPPRLHTNEAPIVSVLGSLGSSHGQPWHTLGALVVEEITMEVNALFPPPETWRPSFSLEAPVLFTQAQEAVLRAECRRAAQATTEARRLRDSRADETPFHGRKITLSFPRRHGLRMSGEPLSFSATTCCSAASTTT